MTKEPLVEWLGMISYEEAHHIMKEKLKLRLEKAIPDTLLLCTHPPVYTVGRQKDALQNLINVGDVPVVPVERGGNVTFHGLGQLVGYPIVQIPAHKQDIHAFLRFLEDYWIIQLQKWNVFAERDERNTGVWVEGKKLVAIGIALRRWVSWHGFAINIDVDLSYFHRINPCGMNSRLVTRLCDLTDIECSLEIMRAHVEGSFFTYWKQWSM